VVSATGTRLCIFALVKQALMRVVIVDDEWNGMELVKEMIRQIRPTAQIIGIYQDPKEALRNIPLVEPDLIILDLEMPYISGLEINTLLKDTGAWFLMTTAHDIYNLKNLKDYHHAEFLSKPFNKRELEEKITRLESLMYS
jgi:two-component system LytT family response regulator